MVIVVWHYKTECGIPLRRSQLVRKLVLLNDYVYLHERDLNIGQSNDQNSSNETVFYSDSDN